MTRERDEAILRLGLKTEADLDAALGELTEEERRILADPALYAPPTEEELARLGPDFTARVLELARQHRTQTSELTHDWRPSGAPGRCGYVDPDAFGTVEECGKLPSAHPHTGDS